MRLKRWFFELLGRPKVKFGLITGRQSHLPDFYLSLGHALFGQSQAEPSTYTNYLTVPPFPKEMVEVKVNFHNIFRKSSQ